MPARWDVDCALPSRVTDWTKIGGSSETCVTGRCPGTSGVLLSGGNRWAIRYSVGSIPYPPTGGGGGGAPWHPTRVFGVGYSGVYANIATLDGNPASVYWIMMYVNPGGDFNETAPGIGLAVLGDGSLSVLNDHLTFATTPTAGLVVAGTTYFFEFAGKVDGAVGSGEARLNGVAVPSLSVTAVNTRSAQVTTEDGFDYVGIGSNQSITFNDFYFSETGFEGPTPCGTQFAGVMAYTHTFENGTLRTVVEIGGQPKGGYKRWRPLGQKPLPKLPINLPPEPPVGGGLTQGKLTQSVTIAAAAFTDTTILMPAGAVVWSVNVLVTTAIPGPTTSFSVGNAGNTTRFSTANVPTALGSSDPGTLAAGSGYNATATAVRLTMNGGSPATNVGRVRVTINYII